MKLLIVFILGFVFSVYGNAREPFFSRRDFKNDKNMAFRKKDSDNNNEIEKVDKLNKRNGNNKIKVSIKKIDGVLNGKQEREKEKQKEDKTKEDNKKEDNKKEDNKKEDNKKEDNKKENNKKEDNKKENNKKEDNKKEDKPKINLKNTANTNIGIKSPSSPTTTEPLRSNKTPTITNSFNPKNVSNQPNPNLIQNPILNSNSIKNEMSQTKIPLKQTQIQNQLQNQNQLQKQKQESFLSPQLPEIKITNNRKIEELYPYFMKANLIEYQEINLNLEPEIAVIDPLAVAINDPINVNVIDPEPMPIVEILPDLTPDGCLDPLCELCDINNSIYCHQCLPGGFLFDKKCFNDCPDGFMADIYERRCINLSYRKQSKLIINKY